MKRWRGLFLFGLGLLASFPIAAKERAHHNDCKAQFQFSKTQVSMTADYLKKITGTLSLEPKTLAGLDKWTTMALDNQEALCEAYSKATETQFPTSRYLAELEALRAWQLDFLKIVITAQDVQEKQASGGKGPNDPDVAQLKSNIKDQITSFLENPPGSANAKATKAS